MCENSKQSYVQAINSRLLGLKDSFIIIDSLLVMDVTNSGSDEIGGNYFKNGSDTLLLPLPITMMR